VTVRFSQVLKYTRICVRVHVYMKKTICLVIYESIYKDRSIFFRYIDTAKICKKEKIPRSFLNFFVKMMIMD